VKVTEKLKRRTGLDYDLAGRVEATAQDLNVMGQRSLASTEVDSNIMDTICM
jgi:hypothetical protein